MSHLICSASQNIAIRAGYPDLASACRPVRQNITVYGASIMTDTPATPLPCTSQEHLRNDLRDIQSTLDHLVGDFHKRNLNRKAAAALLAAMSYKLDYVQQSMRD